MINMELNSRLGRHHAYGVFVNHVVIVKKGSRICLLDSYNKLPCSVKKLRDNKEIVGSDGVIKQDVTFSSPTAAAQFVTGRSVNGYIVWRPENKKKK